MVKSALVGVVVVAAVLWVINIVKRVNDRENQEW